MSDIKETLEKVEKRMMRLEFTQYFLIAGVSIIFEKIFGLAVPVSFVITGTSMIAYHYLPIAVHWMS